MVAPFLFRLWLWLEPAAGNHLWQSTVFGVVAALLVLALRKNRARARYWVWLAASVKFLIPFSLLIAFGGYLAPSRSPAPIPAGYSYAIEMSQPFATPAMGTMAPVASDGDSSGLAQWLPALLLLTWFCGFASVLAFWCIRWNRIRTLARQAAPMDAGREIEALRRLERSTGIQRPIPLLLSAASLEPGVFGIFRPVLLWPEGISAHLSEEHLETILAHELRHVHYRDNLAAAAQSLGPFP